MTEPDAVIEPRGEFRPLLWHERPLADVLTRLAEHESALLCVTPTGVRSVGRFPVFDLDAARGTASGMDLDGDGLAMRLLRAAEARGWAVKLEHTWNPGEWRCEVFGVGRGWMCGRGRVPYAVLHAAASSVLTLDEVLAGRGGWAE